MLALGNTSLALSSLLDCVVNLGSSRTYCCMCFAARAGPIAGCSAVLAVRRHCGYRSLVCIFAVCEAGSKTKQSKKQGKKKREENKKNSLGIRPVTMETRCFHRKLEFQRYPPKDFCTARYEHKPSKKKFQTFKNPEKKHSWADLGPRSIDKNNDCAMKSERGALVTGSDPPSSHSVDKTTGDRWRPPARRLIQTHLSAAV